jgi:hypothetical protein
MDTVRKRAKNLQAGALRALGDSTCSRESVRLAYKSVDRVCGAGRICRSAAGLQIKLDHEVPVSLSCVKNTEARGKCTVSVTHRLKPVGY